MDAIPSQPPPNPQDLPSDPQALKAIILGLHQRLAQRESALELCDLHMEQIRSEAAAEQARILQQLTAEQEARHAELLQQVQAEQAKRIEQVQAEAQRQIDLLKQQHQAEIQALLRRFYGPKSERFDPCQLLLFGMLVDPAEDPVPTSAPAEAAAAIASRPGVVRRGIRDAHGRGLLPAHLPRVQVLHDLPEAAKAGLVKIGEVITEQLEYQAARLFVVQHVQCKYALPPQQQTESAGIVLAEKPAQPIAKGLPGPGLLAYIITSKLADHLPLYRLETIFARSGVQIGRSTMCDWMGACGDLVKPLTDRMAEQVRQSRVIHTDDTKIPVQDEQMQGKCKSGRLWGYLGDAAHAYNVYDYTPDRGNAGPHAWLKGYAGYLQADAYGVYDREYAGGTIIEVACWAHARRKFYDALETDRERCTAVLRLIQQLYQVEREADEKGMDEAAIAALRQQKSVPVLARIKAWLEQQKQVVLPRSAVGLAIQYCLNQWDALCVYTTKGFLAIDNNPAERAMKPVAMGRKNWLFAGNDRAAERMARLLTLVQSAKRHGLDVQRYLSSVLAKIAGTPLSELEQFLPERWKIADAAEPWPGPTQCSAATSGPSG
jgi:transposase